MALPPYISKPIISQLNTSMIPIVNIAVTFEDGLTAENMEFAQRNTSSHYIKILKVFPDVDYMALQIPVISVKIDNEKLAENQVPLQAVMGVLHGQNTLSCW